MTDTTNPATTSETYDRLEKLRKPCRDSMRGRPAITDPANAALYRPREPMELPVYGANGTYVDPWSNRIKNARWTPFYRDAVDSLVGKVFSRSPKPAADTPPELVRFLDDVDGQGANVSVFALARCANSVAEGIDFVLVDLPAVDANLRRSVADDRGLRPYWCAYSAESVFFWRTEQRNGVLRAAEVRLRESVVEPDGEWGLRCVDQIRVLTAGNPDADATDDSRFCRWAVYRKNERGEWAMALDADGKPIQGLRRPHVDIPLVDISTDSTGFWSAEPPLQDLAHLGLAYYRKALDLDAAQHEVGMPLFGWSDISVDEAKKQLAGGIGTNRFLVGGNAKYIEPQGTSWAALEKTMETIAEEARRVAGEPLLQTSSGNLTATGEAIRASKASSKLESWVARWQDAFSELMRLTAIDFGLISTEAESGWGSLELSKTWFPTMRDTEGLRILAERAAAGKLSDASFHEALQRAELVPAGLSWTEEQRRLSHQAPALGEVGRAPALVRRVLELVRSGMTDSEALFQAEAEADSGEQFPVKQSTEAQA